MQLQNQPCTTQVAGRPSVQSDPAKLRETSDTILAAKLIIELVLSIRWDIPNSPWLVSTLGNQSRKKSFYKTVLFFNQNY